MNVVEGEPRGDILPLYYSVDPDVDIGGIPLVDCLDMQAAVADPAELSAGARYDFAWLALETSMAMVRAGVNPVTEAAYRPRDINVAIEQTRALFRSVSRDETAPPALRVRARLAGGSVSSYHESLTPSRVPTIGKAFGPYTRAIHSAAGDMLAIEDLDPEGTELAHEITVVALGTEYGSRTTYFLPASSRQPWGVNAVSRQDGRQYGLIVGDRAPEDIIALPQTMLEFDALSMLRHGGDTLSPLRIYAHEEPGFGARSTRSSLEQIGLEVIATRIFTRMNEKSSEIDARAAEAAGAVAVAAEVIEAEEPILPEVAWYKAQPSDDIHSIPTASLLAHMHNLECAAAKADLQPISLHALAWMHIDYAQMLALQADEIATDVLQQARAHFDAAEAALQASHDLLGDERGGERSEVALDIAALPVYQALFAPATAEELPRATETYLRRLAALAPVVRDATRRFSHNEKQRDSALGTGIRTLMALMLTGANDEAVRHLVLPASIRGGGPHGEAHLVIFPLEVDGYNRTLAVTVKLVNGAEIHSQERQYLEVGLRALASGGTDGIVPTLSRIAGVVRTFKNGAHKRKSHGAATDRAALALSDAVADVTA